MVFVVYALYTCKQFLMKQLQNVYKITKYSKEMPVILGVT